MRNNHRIAVLEVMRNNTTNSNQKKIVNYTVINKLEVNKQTKIQSFRTKMAVHLLF